MCCLPLPAPLDQWLGICFRLMSSAIASLLWSHTPNTVTDIMRTPHYIRAGSHLVYRVLYSEISSMSSSIPCIYYCAMSLITEHVISFTEPFRHWQKRTNWKWTGIALNSNIRQITKYILLTYSMVQSPWAANWFAASQVVPRISWNPKVH